MRVPALLSAVLTLVACEASAPTTPDDGPLQQLRTGQEGRGDFPLRQ